MNRKGITFKQMCMSIVELVKCEETVFYIKGINTLDSTQALKQHKFPSPNSAKARRQL